MYWKCKLDPFGRGLLPRRLLSVHFKTQSWGGRESEHTEAAHISFPRSTNMVSRDKKGVILYSGSLDRVISPPPPFRWVRRSKGRFDYFF